MGVGKYIAKPVVEAVDAVTSYMKEIVDGLPDDWVMKTDSTENYLKKRGVKPEELEFSGMSQTLKEIQEEGRDKVGKKDLQTVVKYRDDKFFKETRDLSEVEENFLSTTIHNRASKGFNYKENVYGFRQEEDKTIRFMDSAHFADDTSATNNYLMHTRTTDRPLTPGGDIVKVVEEIQSKLHQTGSVEGYGKAYKPHAFTDYELVIPNTPLKKTWFGKAIERELLTAKNEGLNNIAIPLTGDVSRLSRAYGVQKQIYDKQAPATMRKLASKMNATYREVTEEVQGKLSTSSKDPLMRDKLVDYIEYNPKFEDFLRTFYTPQGTDVANIHQMVKTFVTDSKRDKRLALYAPEILEDFQQGFYSKGKVKYGVIDFSKPKNPNKPIKTNFKLYSTGSGAAIGAASQDEKPNWTSSPYFNK